MRKNARKLFIAVATAWAAATTNASEPIVMQDVTSKNSADLGFQVDVKDVGGAIAGEMTGPIELNSGCVPRSSGTWLNDAKGSERMVFRAFFSAPTERPVAYGYYTDQGDSMSAFIDYYCPDSRGLESRRYVVRSI